MKVFATNTLRQFILRKIYQLLPFSLKGDLAPFVFVPKDNFISCLIPAARGPETLEALLVDLSRQTLNKDQFEVIVLDNSSQGLDSLISKYSNLLSLKYLRDASIHGFIGHFRNCLLERAQGAYVLFLDDDTRISQRDFLENALAIFKEFIPDVVMPHGNVLVASNSSNYKFLDPYSFANRCCLFKRTALESAGGFLGEMTAYEDIELGIRLCLLGRTILKTDELQYEHPSFFFESLKKPLAIGQSIFKLQKHYPWYMWIVIYLNVLRFLPLGLVPTIRNRQWFKISWGVLLAPFVRQSFSYKTSTYSNEKN